eukprot:26944-Eustigmatos_ZCMA.PRE.1
MPHSLEQWRTNDPMRLPGNTVGPQLFINRQRTQPRRCPCGYERLCMYPAPRRCLVTLLGGRTRHEPATEEMVKAQ